MRDIELLLIALSLVVFSVISPSIGNGTGQYSGLLMNATISQPICIELSPQLAAGIFFTNTTTIGQQYPITDMEVWNNATENYHGPSYGTLYNVTACAGATGVYKIYQSVCDDLKNTTVGGTIYIKYKDYGDGEGYQGIGVSNGTSPTGVENLPTFGPVDGPDHYFLIGYNISRSYSGRESLFLRYWLNPYPNNIPSGIYTTMFKIKAVDYMQPEPADAAC